MIIDFRMLSVGTNGFEKEFSITNIKTDEYINYNYRLKGITAFKYIDGWYSMC